MFAQALALPATERDSFVVQACGDDHALRDEVRRLLAADQTPGAQITDAVGLAARHAVRLRGQARAGERLGPWRIVSHLADGGMGAVYRGERADGLYQQQVAVKLINPAFVSPHAVERMEAERRILALLAHPNIARLLDSGYTADGAPYLVMEYVDGVAIDAYCSEQGLRQKQRLRLFQQVCAAVHHAHRHLVIHRDLKPSNILVDRDGVPKLLDFGIAKLLEQTAGLTRAGERMLTPSHASPEQIRGEPVSAATDVYALGVLLYRLLSGHSPHEVHGDDPGRLARAVLEQTPPLPSTVAASGGAELRGDLDAIVMTALRKEPQRRYASAAALADDIENHLQQRPVAARPDTFGYRFTKLLRRHPRGFAGAGVGLLGVVALVAFYTWQLAAERDHARHERATAEQVTVFMESLFASADPEAEPDPKRTARDVALAAGKRIEVELQGQDETRQRLMLILGRVYRNLGLWTEAQSMLQRAAEIGSDASEADTLTRAQALQELAGILGQMHKPEAIEALRRAHGIRAMRLGPLHLDTLSARVALCLALVSFGQEQDALAEIDATRDQVKRLNESASRNNLLADLESHAGQLLARMARPAEAATHLRLALELSPLPGHASTASEVTMAELVHVLQQSGAHAEAERHALKLIAHMQTHRGPQFPGTLLVRNTYVTLLHAQGRLEEAAAQARELVAAWPPGGGTSPLATFHTNLGRALRELGRLPEAQEAFERAVALRRKASQHDFRLANVVAKLGAVQCQRGDCQAGTRHIEEGLALAREVDGGQIKPRHAPLYTELASARLALRQPAQARVAADAARAALRDSQNPELLARAALVDGQVALAEGRREAARQAFAQVLAALGDKPTPRLVGVQEAARLGLAHAGPIPP